MHGVGLSCFVEIVGTFVFVAVILLTGAAIPIAIALACAIFLGGSVSGGHFNPIVSFSFLMHEKLGIGRFIAYIISQMIGAALAVVYAKSVEGNKKNVQNA